MKNTTEGKDNLYRKNKQKSLFKQIAEAKMLYLSLLPTFLFLAIFIYYPTFLIFYRSFFRWDGVTICQFVGLNNFKELFNDETFIRSLENVSLFLIFRVAVLFLFPFIAAELIVNLINKKIAYAWKLIFVVPMVVPYIVMLLIWAFIYDPSVGLLNQLLRAIGLGKLTRPWLGSPNTALFALCFLRFPWIPTMQFLILLGGLQSIPQSVIESSRLDGASILTRIIKIDIPIILPNIGLVIILTSIWMLQQFQMFLILTGGGPGHATMVPGLYLYISTFDYGEFGYASSIAVVMFGILFTLMYINKRYVKAS